MNQKEFLMGITAQSGRLGCINVLAPWSPYWKIGG